MTLNNLMVRLWECEVPLHCHCSQVLWPRMVAPERVLSIDQKELFGIQTVYLCLTELFRIDVF